MAITEVKIHPAIGIARVGNSPDEFFIGPETADLPEIPAGGYKDAQCRVKRQAARFRVFAYHDDGTPPQELTSPQAQITWKVKLANTKDDTSHDIVASERSVSGPNAAAYFDDGHAGSVNVKLGELRTESNGGLLVLGGHGVAGDTGGASYDDVSDGYVKATVTVGAQTFEAYPGWVIVGPPNHAPGVRPIITLYDKLFEFSNQSLPAQISFRRDIYPILKAALRHRGVYELYGHYSLDVSFPLDQNARTQIVANLKQLGGTMPKLTGAQLTGPQFEMMKRWRDNDLSYVDDWATPAQPLALTPVELDRGPISHAVGASFAPGIECGNSMINGTVTWLEPFRINATSTIPGSATRSLWSPWQRDWKACGGTWWPSQRPVAVIPQGSSGYTDWDAGVADGMDMRSKWHTLGFVVQETSDVMRQVERCDAPYIVLLTPALHFIDVPQGPGGVSTSRLQAIVFEVSSTGTEHFEFVSGGDTNGFSRYTTGQVPAGPTSGAPAQARLWVKYTTAAVGSVSGTVIVKHTESGRQWEVSLAANTVARQTAAVALVLDRSGSMIEPRGDSVPKIENLQEAVDVLATVAVEGDGISCVAFNGNVTGQLAVTPLGPVTDPNDPGREAVRSFAELLTPDGSTSIGDGIDAATAQLAGVSNYGRKATVVITDGKENQPKWIADVAGQINSFTYAIGIGRPDNIDVGKLQALTGNHGGYLLVTGPIAGDNKFILTKYLMQILAGVSNADIVLDPEGTLLPAQTLRIPFQISDADLMFDVILLSEHPKVVDFRLITPLGHEITPASAAQLSEVEHVLGTNTRFYRVRVPVDVEPHRPSHPGQWQAQLGIAGTDRHLEDMTGHLVEERIDRLVDDRPGRHEDDRAAHRTDDHADPERTGELYSRSTRWPLVPYSLLVHTWSEVSFSARLHQREETVGSPVSVNASLTFCGAPFDGEAGAWIELTDPKGTLRQIPMTALGEGDFRAEFGTDLAGAYRARVRAQGKTARGWIFHREQTLTAAVSRGGLTVPAGEPGHGFNDLLRCLLHNGLNDEARRMLASWGIDLKAVERCLHEASGGDKRVIRDR
jgi:Mg-chelatase subunit ChlD